MSDLVQELLSHSIVRGDMYDQAADLIERQAREIESKDKAARMVIDTNSKHLGRLEDERYALAAHVELIKKAYNKAGVDIKMLFDLQPMQPDNSYLVDGQDCTELNRVIMQSPQTSLAEHDREVKAKAIEEAAQKVAHEVANSYSGVIDDGSEHERAWNDGANQTLRKFVRGFQKHANEVRNGKDSE